VRKFFIVLILFLGIVFFITRFTEVKKIYAILQMGSWHFVWLGIFVEGLWMLNVSASYQSLYDLMGIKENLGRFFQLTNAANFVNIVTPASGGVPALAVYLGDAQKRGYPVGKVMAAWALYLFFEYLGLLGVVTLALIVLFRRNNLNWSEITAAIILVAIAFGLATLISLGMRAPQLLGDILAGIAHAINRVMWIFLHRPYLSEERSHAFARDVSDGLAVLRGNQRGLLRPLLLAATNKVLLGLILWTMFLAFDASYSVGTMIGALGICYLFVIVSPTPSGVGVVEGIMTLTLVSLRVEVEAATVITLGFRGITFWLPLLVGAVTFRRLS